MIKIIKLYLSNKIFLLILRVFLSFIFILAGAEKIATPEAFAVSIENYKLFPTFSINIFAILIPWIELFTGIMLLLGVRIKEDSLIISSLLIIFIILIIISILRGLDINCGCFGTANGHTVGVMKVLENLILLFISILLIRYDSQYKI